MWMIFPVFRSVEPSFVERIASSYKYMLMPVPGNFFRSSGDRDSLIFDELL